MKKTEENQITVADNTAVISEPITDKDLVIGTSELSGIISDVIGRSIEPKRLRSILRNDSVLSEYFDDSDYTKYRFNRKSQMVNRIIERFKQIESERSERKNRADIRKTERKNRAETVIDLDDNGKLKTEKIEANAR